MQVTWRLAVRWIERSEEHHTLIAWRPGPPDRINARGSNVGIITVTIQYGGEHWDCRIAIQLTRLNRMVVDYTQFSVKKKS